jgi:hypothetical protein
MPTPREELEQLRALAEQQATPQAAQQPAATPRQELEQLRAQQAEQPQVPVAPPPISPEELRQQATQFVIEEGEPGTRAPVLAQLSGLPTTETMQAAGTGPAEAALTIGTGAIAEPVAGVAGLATLPFADTEKATENIEAVREALTFIPRTPEGMQSLQRVAEVIQPIAEPIQTLEKGLGEAGFETAGPVGGAAGETLPTLALEAVPGVAAVRRGVKRAVDIQKEIPETAQSTAEAIADSKPSTDVGAEIGDIKSGVEPEAKNYEQIASDLKRKKTKRLAEQVMPDEDVIAAAKDLNVDLNPSHYSTNRSFIEVEQSLKSRPGSKLAAIEEKAIRDLGDRADELIQDIGGETDKSLLDANVRQDITGTIDNLEAKADVAYKAVDEAIPKDTIVTPIATRSYLNKVINELGGDKTSLTTAEKKLLSLADEGKTPTYALLDRIRKDVGNGFRKNKGPFKDDDSGTLKQVYRALSEDQQGVADAFGVGADYAAARKLVQTRKELEDAAKTLLGRDLQGSIVQKLQVAGTALTKGDISKFSKLMKSLPEARRAEAAATMLNDIFTLGARRKGAIGQGFMGAVESLNRNVAAKNILFNQLPPGSKARFDKIGKVATGIFKSKALENTSRTARDVVAAMNDAGMFGRIYGVGRRAAGILPGVRAANIAESMLVGKTPITDAADEFITSRAFSQAIEKAAKTGNAKAADQILKGNKSYNKWLGHLDSTDAALITSIGFIPWVTGQTQSPAEEQ